MAYTGYNVELSRKIVKGFTSGFELGHYNNPIGNNVKQPKLSPDLHLILMEKINNEVTLGRIKGPFYYPPFQNFQISPVTIREKSTPGKYRLLHNLSYPYDESSINNNITENHKTVKYSNIKDAIKCLNFLGPGTFTAKSDIKDAFRLIPIRQEDHPKLGIHVNNSYYYDTTLPMGSSSSCQLFELFSTALHHIVQFFMPHCHLIHYIDDFFFMAKNKLLCDIGIQIFKDICNDIGVPLAPGKTTSPSLSTSFLGIQLDTACMCAKLPEDKLIHYTEEVKVVIKKRSITKHSLQSLIGKLSFASSVVPARAFLRRMITFMSRATHPHHYITINKTLKSDLLTWLTFLENYNGITYFRALGSVNSDTLYMGSDASKMGFGCTFLKHWIQGKYSGIWREKDITTLELYPIYLMMALFGRLIKNSNIIFYCDNMAIVHIINSQSTKHPFMMSIVRSLVLILVEHNINLTCRHIPGKINHICDRLSRFQDAVPLLKEQSMSLTPTEIPTYLLPQHYQEL